MFGMTFGAAWAGGGVLEPVLIALGAGTMLVIAWRPIVGICLVPAVAGLGNKPIPGAPNDLQAVHVVIAMALVGAVLHLILYEDRSWLRPGKSVLRSATWIGAFALASVVSGLLAAAPIVSLNSNITLLGATGIAVLTGILVSTSGVARLLLTVMVVSSIGALAPVLTQLSGVTSELGGSVIDNRPTGAFVDPNELGAYSVVAIVLAFTLMCLAGRSLIFVGAVGAAFAILALVMSFSRGSWIAATATAIMLLAIKPYRRRMWLWGVVVSVLGASALMSGSTDVPYAVVLERVHSLITSVENPYDVRPYIWEFAFRLFLDNPLWGIGPANFPRAAAQAPGLLWAYPVLHAHNGPLTVAAETGLAGLVTAAGVVLSVGWGLVTACRNAARSSRADNFVMSYGVLVALLGVGASLMVDYTLRNPVVLTNVWVLVGLGVGLAGLDDREQQEATKESSTGEAVPSQEAAVQVGL